jgi:hypothetical protein
VRYKNHHGDEIVPEVGTPPPTQSQSIAHGTRVPTAPPATANVGVWCARRARPRTLQLEPPTRRHR